MKKMYTDMRWLGDAIEKYMSRIATGPAVVNMQYSAWQQLKYTLKCPW